MDARTSSNAAPGNSVAGWSHVKRLKSWIKSHNSDDAVGYNLMAWSYGVITRRPSVRRAALMRLLKDSRFDETELFMASLCPRTLLDAVVDEWNPSSFLDVGCGVGLAMQYLIEKGVQCLGLEGSAAAIARSPVKSQIRRSNLNRAIDLARQFDVVWSYEVAEHIHPKFVPAFLDTLTKHGDHLVLSAAPPGQGGHGHFNEQPQEYWIQRLAERDFLFNRQLSETFQQCPEQHASNVMVFRRAEKAHTTKWRQAGS